MAVEISQGVCDLCGAPSDASLQECNWLTCTYQHCEGGLYHQECLEKYLKSNKLEKNRKTGFKCPRGCGKGTRFDQACPGRIDKSHPIHPRNEDKKKTKLAAVVVEPQRSAKPAAPPPPNGKAAKPKEESKADAGKDAKGAAPTKAGAIAKAAAAGAAASPSTTLGQKAARKDVAVLPPRPEVVAKQKLAELAAQARREIGLPTTNSALSTHGSKGDLQGLAGSAAGPSKPVVPPAPSAWGKPGVSAAELPSISPQPTMMSQLPQFQQLLQQAAGKKQAAKTTLLGSGSVPAPAASKPGPPVPQPVTPPTPVWPALGTAQTSAAALFSASSTPLPQTPREATPRPGSPAWGGSSAAAAASSSSQQQQQAAAQQQAQQAAVSAPAASMRNPHAGAGTSGSSSSSSSLTAPASAAAVSSSSTPVTAAAMAAATGFGVASASGRTVAAEPPAATLGAGTGVAGSSSSSAGIAAPAGPSTATAASRCGSQLVGAEFDDEAKEPKLTKAQKKNLKRTEKKKSPLGASGDQQQGAGDGPVGPEVSEAPSRGSVDGAAGATSSLHSASGAAADASAARHADAAAASSSGRGAGGGSSSNGAAHRRHVSRGSDDPEQAHVAEMEEAAVMEDLCINCIVARKVLALITQLQRLGALEFVAAAAVQRHGSNLLAALEWLLVAGADAAAAPPEAALAAAAESASAAESEVDISEELHQLNDVQAAMGVPTELLQQCVVDCSGDVQTAANTAMERMLAAPMGSAIGASGASRGGGTGGGRMSSGSGSVLVAGQLNGPAALRGSPSFYSVSSLEGGAASGADSDAVPGQLKPPPQQQARSSHFGVRLQDEPVGCSGGTGYGVGDVIAAGFLRGGVVLGASGWPNGYLREAPTPPPGFATGASAAASASCNGGGRSTSRLLHWLRDEPGRAAALAEEQASVGASRPSNMFASDPVLDSPFSAHGRRAGGPLAAREAGRDAPSLEYWLGCNGYHHASAPGAAGPTGASTAGIGGRSYMYGGEASNCDFSFASALSKPPSLGESLGGYGSRWTSMGASEGSRQDAPGGLLFGGATGEGEAGAHADGDTDLSSILLSCNALRS